MARDIFVHMVVYESRDGENDWEPRDIKDLPLWLLEPDIMAQLADGQQCNNSAFGAMWYRGMVIDPPKLNPIVEAMH